MFSAYEIYFHLCEMELFLKGQWDDWPNLTSCLLEDIQEFRDFSQKASELEEKRASLLLLEMQRRNPNSRWADAQAIVRSKKQWQNEKFQHTVAMLNLFYDHELGDQP
jgi:malonyl CoA-acyl carrier protein transacylase